MDSIRTFLTFKDSRTGELVRLEQQGDYDDCRLSNDPDLPVFEAPDEAALGMVLFENTPSYNAGPKCPGWGPFSRERLVPTRVTVRSEFEELVLPTLANVKKSFELRDIPHTVAQRYAGTRFEPVADTKRSVFWLVELPDGETLESVQAWEGKQVYGGDKWTRRVLYKAVEVPEEYVPLVKGKNAALFLASEALSS